MHIETEATQHLQRAANAARAASHVLARLPDAERNAALQRDGSGIAIAVRRDTCCQRHRPCGLRRHCCIPRPAHAHRSTRRCHGQGAGGHRATARSAGPHAGRLDAAERPAHSAHCHADRRDRHDLRKPAECRRRCRGHLPEVGQRGDPARRFGKPAQRAGDQCCTGDGIARGWTSGSLCAGRTECRSRLCRGDAGGGRTARPDRAARRQVSGRAGAA